MAASTSSADRPIRAGRAKAYPKEIWWFIVSLIFLVSLCHLSNLLLSKFRQWRQSSKKADPEGQGSVLRRGTLSLTRIPLALINLYRVIAFRCTLQIGSSYSLCLADVFLTCTYIAIIFGWALTNTTDVEGVKFDYTYYSNRAGTLAASQFPLIVALGTKNNPITLLTGVSYEKMNSLHRMCSRVLFVLLWLHAGSKFAKHTLTGEDWSATWLHVGLMALIAFCVLVLVSLRPIRAKAYEFFFYTHFALALIILLGAYFHARTFNFGQYVWPSFLIWALDRAIRLARLVYFRIASYIGSRKSPASGAMDAKLDLLSPHMVRVRIARPPAFHWSPGQLAYLILPSVSLLPIEAHPFSIASIDSPVSEETADEKEKGQAYFRELVFLINAREGFTRRLADRVAEGNASVVAFVDGPYGISPDLNCAETIVLIAGGTGISHTLPLLLSVVAKRTARRVLFVWAIRDKSHLNWVAAAIKQALAAAPSTMSISISIHLTTSQEPLPGSAKAWDDDSVHNERPGEMSRSESPESMEKEKGELSLTEVSAVKIQVGRPNIGVLMKEELDSATGRMAVSVCGSEGIARAVRSAFTINPLAGSNSVVCGAPSVTLHVESFGYA
ncbi:iron reductase [Neolentinus lepideus HHB14362 ss-1]|uniref:ferric-chelate reductase (NADPH) n=1 Tax=Neolentinus lepideus HHB14362 ss-1 TaxID=1314782 RepID=A0A165R275_9AGAM|nr:iron reductase [Neolentinus lepideus HHB14362 ss-1]